MKARGVPLLLGIGLCLWFGAGRAALAAPESAVRSRQARPLSLSTEGWKKLAEQTDIGLRGGAADLPQALDALRDPECLVQMEALWALARLGDQQALPAVRALAEAPPDGLSVYTRVYAQVVAAQLAVVPAPARDPAQLRAQTEAVVRTVGLTPTEIAVALTGKRRASDLVDPTDLLALYTIRQIADMVLLAADRGIANAAAAAPVDLSLEPGAQLKAELSVIPASERLSYLMGRMAQFKVLSTRERYLIKFLTHEGPAAVPAIITRLEDGSAYSPAARAALLETLAGIGGDAAREYVGRLRAAGDGDLRGVAERHYQNLRAGIHTAYVKAY